MKMRFRFFIAHTTHTEIAYVERDVATVDGKPLRPLNPFAIPQNPYRGKHER